VKDDNKFDLTLKVIKILEKDEKKNAETEVRTEAVLAQSYTAITACIN
jgi:hypothetical protein